MYTWRKLFTNGFLTNNIRRILLSFYYTILYKYVNKRHYRWLSWLKNVRFNYAKSLRSAGNLIYDDLMNCLYAKNYTCRYVYFKFFFFGSFCFQWKTVVQVRHGLLINSTVTVCAYLYNMINIRMLGEKKLSLL